MFGHRFYGRAYFGPRYWGDGGDGTPPEPPVTATPETSGIRHSRFLRRGPKLPWEEIEEVTDDGVVVKSRRKRIPLPQIQRIERIVSPIPVERFKELPAVEITIPELGTARLERYDEDEEDELLWLI